MDQADRTAELIAYNRELLEIAAEARETARAAIIRAEERVRTTMETWFQCELIRREGPTLPPRHSEPRPALPPIPDGTDPPEPEGRLRKKAAPQPSLVTTGPRSRRERKDRNAASA